MTWGFDEHHSARPWRQRFGRLMRLTLKEQREILRDRRTILTLVLMPVLLYPLLTIVFQQFFLSSLSRTQQAVFKIAFPSQEDAIEVMRFLGLATPTRQPPVEARGGFAYETMPPPEVQTYVVGDIEAAVQAGSVDLGIRATRHNQVFSPNANYRTTFRIVYLKHSYLSQKALEYLEKQMASANTNFLRSRLRALGVTQRAPPVEVEATPLDDDAKPGPTISLAALIPLILILMTITGAVYPAIDLTAGERERGTLEILVAAPVPRLSLLLAKYIAVLTVAMLTATVNLGSMIVTLSVSGLGPLVLGESGTSPMVLLQVFALLILFAAFFSAVLLALTSFARSFKEAQAYLIPLMLVSLAPGVASLVPGLRLAGMLRLAPLLNIVLLARDLLSQSATASSAAIVVASTLLYALGAITVAARIFGAEGVLYSDQAGWQGIFRRPSESRPTATIPHTMFALALLFPTLFLAKGLIRGGTLGQQILWAAACQVLLFGGLTALVIHLQRVKLVTGLAFRWPRWPAWIAATLLGVSLWAFVHEVIVLLNDWGIVRIQTELLEQAEKLVRSVRREIPPWQMFFALALAPAVFEELLFRGLLLQALRRRLPPWRAIAVSGIVFGLFHLVAVDNLAFERLVPTTLLGCVLGWVCWRTQSVFPGMILHACNNGYVVASLYFAERLKQAGLGIERQWHLPATWLVTAAIVAAAGGYILHRFGAPLEEDSYRDDTAIRSP